ncbi:nitrate- and nitrite sensing domain-containing protein [Streptomyces sp. CRN 30]|uniref:nitrate- and nitrite sensing domain-containing protein n=1 Tax=Streptomyces sp. CRN 30 TaxID=3075613 RepID=UPI002A835BE1|nr:nitrate- and nitrite sensing domain-containing protein [Streptomyces sp. CRN 30]
MRAPVQKTRPRRTGKQTAPAEGAERSPATPGTAGTPGTAVAPGTAVTPGASGASGTPAPAVPVGKGRPTHVRNRLIVAVLVVAAAIAGAGAPSLLTASEQLKDSQDLVTLAERTQDALTLAHSLADERDEVTPYIAAGRPKSKAPSEQRGARVDRQVEEVRADPDTPAALREDLDAVTALRRAALTGRSSALEAHDAYSAVITELHALAEELAEEMPPRAGAGAYALAELDSAVQQAAAARGLLVAALSVPRSTQTTYDPVTGLPAETSTSSEADTEQRDALAAAAQEARVRSDAALADFRSSAPEATKERYDATVTGPEADTAEKYLAALTDRPELSDDDLGTSVTKLTAALSARVDAMRGAESALYDRRTKDLARLRDDDVTALELRVAVLGALMLVAVGIATAMARSLTRPLSALRRGTARLADAENPAAEEPVTFTGRNDEFAKAVRSVNTLHAHAVTLAERVTTLEADRKHLVGQRQKMADAREELRAELAESAARLEQVRQSIGSTFVSLALRTLGLVERQLGVIESMEEREQDPDRLATLFKLDHFATVMRRHSENLLVLAGTEHVQHSAGPVPLVDVVRAAVSEIERYERVRIAALPPHAHVAGFAADDLSHLLAELLENATAFSPPELPVEVSGWLLENGEVMLSVQDEGIGMEKERLERLNARLKEFDPEAPYEQREEGEDADGLGLGLYVVARLAHRHGARVRLRAQKQGGIAAVVVLPTPLLAEAPPVAVAPAAPLTDGSGTVTLPGADAEANSNVLPGRAENGDPVATLGDPAATPGDPVVTPGDPVVTLAEEAVRRSEPAGAAPAGGPDDRNPTGTEEPATSGTEKPATEEPATSGTEEPAPAATEEPATEEPAATAPDDPETTPTPPSEAVSEITMELLVPAPSPEPGPAATPPTAEPASGTEPDTAAPGPEPEAEPAHDRVPDEPGEAGDPVTDKGLPKRTPRTAEPAAAPRPRTGAVDADALRRRLGGFHQGAQAGRRDVEAEFTEEHTRQAPDAAPGSTAETTGGTVEEASS